MWWVWAIACGPRLPRGEAWITVARAPVTVVDAPSDEAGPEIELVVDAGSERDPLGREGSAWVVADAVFRPLGASWSTTVRSVDARVPCAAGEEASCVDALVAALVAPDLGPAALDRAREAGAASLRWADDAALAHGAVDLIRFRSHPWGHLPAGRTSVLPTLSEAELRSFHRARWTRGRLSVTARGLPPEGVERLREGLTALPPAADPLRPHGGDAPFSHLLDASGVWVVSRAAADGSDRATVAAAWPADLDPDARSESIASELEGTALVDGAVVVLDGEGLAPAVRATLTTTTDRLAAALTALSALPGRPTVVAVTDPAGAEALRAGPTSVTVLDAETLLR
jgi:hypothetical protein